MNYVYYLELIFIKRELIILKLIVLFGIISLCAEKLKIEIIEKIANFSIDFLALFLIFLSLKLLYDFVTFYK